MLQHNIHLRRLIIGGALLGGCGLVAVVATLAFVFAPWLFAGVFFGLIAYTIGTSFD